MEVSQQELANRIAAQKRAFLNSADEEIEYWEKQAALQEHKAKFQEHRLNEQIYISKLFEIGYYKKNEPDTQGKQDNQGTE